MDDVPLPPPPGPLYLGFTTLKNRVLMGAMHTGLADGRDLSGWPPASASGQL